MARVTAQAVFASGSWCLLCPEGSSRDLKGGSFAGFSSLQELQEACRLLNLPPASKEAGSLEEEAKEANPDRALGDDEAETSVKFLSRYFITGSQCELVSLARIPHCPDESGAVFHVHGQANGGESVIKDFKSWKVKFGAQAPIIFVRVNVEWLELRNPIKLYAMDEARTLFVTLQLLNFASKDPKASPDAAWQHVKAVCRYNENRRPSKQDVLEQRFLLRKLCSIYTDLVDAAAIQEFLPFKSSKKRKVPEPDSVPQQDSASEDDIPEPDSEEPEGFGDDTICVICDDGGDLICCEGPCMRSFHASKAPDLDCPTLGLPDYEPIGDKDVPFYCGNCALKLHQCFQCGEIGRSEGPEQEVYRCDVAFCGRFYHTKCGARPEGFACRLHSCFECGGSESHDPVSWLFPCRRCPRAWHRACVSSTISIRFNDDLDGEGEVRGWQLPNARFLYCLDHTICPETATPPRNHLDMKTLKAWTFVKGSRSAKSFLSEPPISVKHKSTPARAALVDAVSSVIQRSVKLVTSETVLARLSMPRSVPSQRNSNNIKIAKLESVIQAAKKAAQCLESGRTILDAQCYLPPQHWQSLKHAESFLRLYLSPMLYGNRYSSYGRHFTQNSKLELIVERLQWYIKPGDMVVDLCCGSNDFSQLLGKKLSEAGKKCFFKNYDIIQPQNTLHFQRKDYMTVQKDELFPGDNLVIGLNPPFGLNASTASMFGEHCASFRPKIIILIVPVNTRRLENFGYELTWQDPNLLQGESFYLPGSVDSKGHTINQENKVPPVLFLWSRADWASRHRSIALEHDHHLLGGGPEEPGEFSQASLASLHNGMTGHEDKTPESKSDNAPEDNWSLAEEQMDEEKFPQTDILMKSDGQGDDATKISELIRTQKARQEKPRKWDLQPSAAAAAANTRTSEPKSGTQKTDMKGDRDPRGKHHISDTHRDRGKRADMGRDERSRIPDMERGRRVHWEDDLDSRPSYSLSPRRKKTSRSMSLSPRRLESERHRAGPVLPTPPGFQYPPGFGPGNFSYAPRFYPGYGYSQQPPPPPPPPPYYPPYHRW